jgi:GNAT superfamily N-acetyltransferase
VNVEYRLASQKDVQGISNVFADAANDLYRKHGLLDTPVSPTPPSPIFPFLIQKTPHAFWVAVNEGEIVGFSDSFVRNSLWFLSWLFISPSYQGCGIGRNLLVKTLESWGKAVITNRATITFSINPTSQSLYIRYGMYAREPLYYVSAPKSNILERMNSATSLDYDEVSSLQDAWQTLRRIDEDVLGFPLDWHHEYFFQSEYRCYIFSENRGLPVGYAYIRPSGGIGPVAVTSQEYMEPILEAALKISTSQKVEEIGYYTPGSNVAAINIALKYRMKFDPFVFMSTKPFAKWENYIFHSAALM